MRLANFTGLVEQYLLYMDMYDSNGMKNENKLLIKNTDNPWVCNFYKTILKFFMGWILKNSN